MTRDCNATASASPDGTSSRATSSATAASASARSPWRRCWAVHSRDAVARPKRPARGPPPCRRGPHISRRRRRRVIHLFMAGAPSQLDLFDYKPKLAEARRQADPAGGHRRPALRLHPPRRGRARAAVQVRQARPVRGGALRDAAAPGQGRRRHLHRQARSAPTSSTTPRRRSSSTPASRSRAGRASARGSSTAWAPRRSDLPAFVVMSTGGGISGGAANWSSGFLPTVYAGVRFRNQGDPILNVTSPPGVDAQAAARHARPGRRAQPPAARRAIGDPEIATRIAAYEMAFRLQTSAPELMDLAQRERRRRSTCTAATRTSRRSPGPACWPGGWSSAACGSSTSTTKAGTPTATSPATSRTTAARPTRPPRRSCTTSSSAACSTTRWSSGAASSAARRWSRRTRRSAAAWAATITRRPSRCGWPAAASSPGMTYGATDDLGFHVAENPVHVHDLQATILHLLGLDHERLTFRHAGRDFRLTDVHGKVVRGILA